MPTWKTEGIGPKPFIAVDHQGEGALVVFLHGIGGNRTNWHDQIPAFAQYFHALVWDARGYGGSDDYDGPYRFEDICADLCRVFDHFGAAKAHVVGLSMGGRVAQDFYYRHAELVATLTLCDTAFGLSADTPEKREAFLKLRQKPLLDGNTPRDIAPSVVPTFEGPNVTPAVHALLIENIASLRRDSYLKAIATSVSYMLPQRLHEIAVPTLAVYGSEDKLTLPAIGETIVSKVPNSRLVVFPGIGHLSNIEAPAEFNRTVLDFLLAHKSLATRKAA
ncbi:MAG: alpha/beta fold hydrolase [Alphaproteobacteria bacterium]|nr:alpha/beta fold hydrolase [Alphaproteobacteria bacterium]